MNLAYWRTFGFAMRNIGNSSVYRGRTRAYIVQLVHIRTFATCSPNRLVMRIVRLYTENGNVFLFSSAEI